jgi:GT2 family glycosyltransferase
VSSSSANTRVVAAERVEGRPLSASILIPSYNRRRLLMETLTSLATQTAPADRYEVIVGIDGSTDETVDVLVQSHFPYRLRWTRQENQGTAAAVNHAAALARHDVLIFLGDDQRAAPELVATHLRAQARYGDVLIQGFYPNAPESARNGASMAYDLSLQKLPEVFASGSARRWHLWGANFSLRRRTWERLGGYDTSFRRCEDTDLGIRLARLGIPSIFVPEARTAHLHRVTHEGFRAQSFTEGRAIVRLAQKHELPLTAFSGASEDGPLDRGLKAAWRRMPNAVDLLGRGLLVGLRAADQVQFRPGQLLLARLVRRTYKLGGIATDPGKWDLGSRR